MESEHEWARAVVRDAASRYLASRRERIDPFVDRYFSLVGTLRLHRRALGWDLLRVPANLVLAPVALIIAVSARIAARTGMPRSAAWLQRHRPMFETAMGREVAWLVTTELLQLPCEQPGRRHTHDGLADAVLADPRVAGWLVASDTPATRAQIAAAIAGYAGTRAATAEIASGCLATGLGALWVKQATPGIITLGSVLASSLAQQGAIAAFPLGAGLGAWWYGMYPVDPSASLIAATTGAAALLGAVFAAFSGLITDPLQRLMGLHRRRLLRLIYTLESGLRGEAVGAFPMRDHYVARLLDLLDLTATLLRTVRV
jgi:hypothetical protein